MRQYAGYATAQETNIRYRYLLEHGSTGLSMAFDLPTQLGRDSDDPLCLGEVGRTGVAIDSIDDMRTAFDQIPLDQVSTSMTINAPAAILLLLYELVGEEQGVPSEQLRGTVQNDILKEYAARGNFIYPPEGAMRLTTDIFAYCHKHIPKWNTISISGYHMREKGCSAVQEVAFTLSNAIAYVQAAIDAGLEVDELRPSSRSSSTATTTSSRRWRSSAPCAGCGREIMRDRFGAKNPRSQMVRFHTQTGGSTLRRSSPRTTSCASRSRASPPSAAARSPSTRTASTRRSACPRSVGEDRAANAAGASRTNPARPTRSTRSPAPITSSG